MSCLPSPAITSPAIQPINAAPTRPSHEKRSSSLAIRVAPTMMIGIEMTRPITIRVKSPLAAAAMAMALSRLITASATMMVQIAAQILSCALMLASSSSSITSLTPIHSSSAPPTSLRYGTDNR